MLATNKVVTESQKLESCGPAGDGDSSVQVKILQVPAKCGPFTAVQPPPTAAAVSKGDSIFAPPKVITTGQGHQPASSTVTAGPQTPSPAIMVITKVAAPGGMSASGQPQVTKTALSQVVPMNQATTPGRTVVITVPRPPAPQPVAVVPRLPSASPQLPTNIQIPPGELLHATGCNLIGQTDRTTVSFISDFNSQQTMQTQCAVCVNDVLLSVS